MRDSKGRFIKGNKHSEEVELRRVQAIKESYASGKRVSWNKGLTKETDERVRKSTEKLIGIRKGVKLSEETKRKMSESHKGKKLNYDVWNKGLKGKGICKAPPKAFKKGHIPSNKGIPRPEISGWNNPSHRPEVREKIRKYRIRYIEQAKLNGNPLYPTIGKYETQMLDTLEESFGYTILRQHKVAGYFLDGFCPALNLAIEIDEKHHQKTKQRQLDIDRDNYLKTNFNYQILRIKQP